VLVGVGGTFEVEADLEAAGPCVVLGLVVELGPAVMKLEQAPVPAAGLVPAKLLWQSRLQGLAQRGEELGGCEERAAYQRAEYIS
jgi:hypothetical protein